MQRSSSLRDIRQKDGWLLFNQLGSHVNAASRKSLEIQA